MAGKVNSDSVVKQLQRAMALNKSDKERPYNSGKRHAGCNGHGCQPTCGYHGYCDYEATRYYSSPKGKAENQNRKESGHSYYRREMRLGYDSSDD